VLWADFCRKSVRPTQWHYDRAFGTIGSNGNQYDG